MSATAIVRDLLGRYAPLTELVPNAKIYAGQIPQNTTLPAISVTAVGGGGDKVRTTARNFEKMMREERVQVTVLAKNYMLMERILKAASLGPGVHSGNVAGFRVNSVLPEGLGPYIGPAGDEIHEQSRDFMVTFVEAN